MNGIHLIPTLNRIEKLKACMSSARATGTSTPGILIVDEDDLMANRQGYDEILGLCPQGWGIEVTKARGMGDKCREIWPKIAHLDWVSLANDEHFYITPSWDVRLLKQLNGKNIVSCNDRWNAPARMAGCTIWSMPLLKELGYPIFPPQINHLGIDDIWEFIGRNTGTWRVDMSVVIEHRHVFRGGGVDDTHVLTYGSGIWQGSPQQQDTAVRVQQWHQQEGKEAIEKIKKFAGTYNYFIKLNPQGAEFHGGAKR